MEMTSKSGGQRFPLRPADSIHIEALKCWARLHAGAQNMRAWWCESIEQYSENASRFNAESEIELSFFYLFSRYPE